MSETKTRLAVWLACGAIAVAAVGVSPEAHAVPTRDEVYRSEKLRTVVYKDSQDPNVFWYLPPVKLFEDKGKLVHYRRPKGDKVVYTFYPVPYMSDGLVEFLAGEVPGLQNKTQLKPIIAKRLGIQVKQFNFAMLGDEVSDFLYLNQPQEMKIGLNASDADDMDFYLANNPGVQANVLFYFDAERMDKYMTIELSYREVYNALNIKGTGRYQFSRAEIEAGVTEYVSKKYYYVKSKGGLPIPEIVNRVIEECFTPIRLEKSKPGYDRYLRLAAADPKEQAFDEQARRLDHMLADEKGKGGAGDNADDTDPATGDDPRDRDDSRDRDRDRDRDRGRDRGRRDRYDDDCDDRGKYRDRYDDEYCDDDDGYDGRGGGYSRYDRRRPKDEKKGNGVEFMFRKDRANSDKAFFYKQEHFVDTHEIAAVPVYLTSEPVGSISQFDVTPLESKDFVVESRNIQTAPLKSGLTVKENEQYVITAVFALAADSPYKKGLHWYRWDSAWPSADEELYYRVGTGPWNKVNGRAVIKADGIYKGEIQFQLNRNKIWEKIPEDFKKGPLKGLMKPIFSYAKTFPQFNVVVSGRRFVLK